MPTRESAGSSANWEPDSPLVTEKPQESNIPNAGDILANFVRVSSLELAKLGTPLDLEVDLFTRRRHDLGNPRKRV